MVNHATFRRILLATGQSNIQISIISQFNGKRFQVITRREEATARFEIELPVMPVTDQHTISDAALGHWIAHVRTTIVNGVKSVPVFEDCKVCSIHMKRLAFSLIKRLSGTQLVVNKICCFYVLNCGIMDVNGTVPVSSRGISGSHDRNLLGEVSFVKIGQS